MLPRHRPTALAALLVVPVVATCSGCERSRARDLQAAPGAVPGASAAPAALDGGAALSAAGSEGGAGGGAASGDRPATWRGTYKSAAAMLYIPDQKDWKGVRFNVKETPTGIGEGTVSFRVDPASGRVVGDVEGPLGPATVDGLSRDGQVSATLRRKDPSDQGFAGTLVGTLAGDHGEGTLSVSTGEASAVRSATFVVTPGAAR